MRDLGLAVSGAKMGMVSSQHESHPANNIIESSGGFWMSCGMFPQCLTISLQGAASITEIGLDSAYVKTVAIYASVDQRPRNFSEVIKETGVASMEGRRQSATIWSGASSNFQARHVRLLILSGYHHFVAIFHIKIMGVLLDATESTSKFSAFQMGIQNVSEETALSRTAPTKPDTDWSVFQTKSKSADEQGPKKPGNRISSRRPDMHQAVRWGNDDQVIGSASSRDPTASRAYDNVDSDPSVKENPTADIDNDNDNDQEEDNDDDPNSLSQNNDKVLRFDDDDDDDKEPRNTDVVGFLP